MWTSAQFKCCGGVDATLANQEMIKDTQQDILDAIAAIIITGGSGDATSAKQDEILDLLNQPHVC